MILPTKTPEETRDAIVAWLKSEATFHRDSARLCGGKRATAARHQEADLIDSLADSLSEYRTPAEAMAETIRKAASLAAGDAA